MMMVDFKKYGYLHNCPKCTEWDGQECNSAEKARNTRS